MAAEDRQLTVKEVRSDLMKLRKGVGFSDAAFMKTKNLHRLPAVQFEVNRPDAEPGGEEIHARRLIMCLLKTGGFTDEEVKILRITMNVDEDPRAFESVTQRRPVAMSATGILSESEFEAVEERAILRLTRLLLEAKKSPCSMPSQGALAARPMRWKGLPTGLRYTLGYEPRKIMPIPSKAPLERYIRSLPSFPKEQWRRADSAGGVLLPILCRCVDLHYAGRVAALLEKDPTLLFLSSDSFLTCLDHLLSIDGFPDVGILLELECVQIDPSVIEELALWPEAGKIPLIISIAIQQSLDLLDSIVQEIATAQAWNSLYPVNPGYELHFPSFPA